MQPQGRYQESVEITQEEYKGTYWTDTPERENAYTYYLNGQRDDEHIHFTVVDTGGGTKAVRKFHITVPFSVRGSTANFHINYFRKVNGTVVPDENFPPDDTDEHRALRRPPFIGTTVHQVASVNRSAAEEYLNRHKVDLGNAAQEFADKVWQ